jgi:hypothetical protein
MLHHAFIQTSWRQAPSLIHLTMIGGVQRCAKARSPNSNLVTLGCRSRYQSTKIHWHLASLVSSPTHSPTFTLPSIRIVTRPRSSNSPEMMSNVGNMMPLSTLVFGQNLVYHQWKRWDRVWTNPLHSRPHDVLRGVVLRASHRRLSWWRLVLLIMSYGIFEVFIESATSYVLLLMLVFQLFLPFQHDGFYLCFDITVVVTSTFTHRPGF